MQGRQPRHILAHVRLLLEEKCLAVQTSRKLACLVFAPCLSHHINRATLLRIMSEAEFSMASVPPGLLTPTQAHRPHRRAPKKATAAPQPMAPSPILLLKLVRGSCSLSSESSMNNAGGYDYRRTTRLRQSIHFSITQVLFADHVH